MLYNFYTCGACGKQFVTDNAWIYCRPDDDRTVEARFCSESCRSTYAARVALVDAVRTAIETAIVAGLSPDDVSGSLAVICSDREHELRKACREALCWLRSGKGKTPAERGAGCDTEHEAVKMLKRAIVGPKKARR